MNLEEGEIVSCVVDRIVGTIVFVKISGNGEGSIILSEIAPGRIRNLRNYVVPKKKIVCKILKIGDSGNIYLSLRRVTQKEKKEVLEQEKQEKSYENILRTILKEKAQETIIKIKKENNLYDFIKESKEKPQKLEKLIGKKDAEKIIKILKTQKIKKALIKKQINLTSTKPNGLELIKNLLIKIKNAEIKYISAGQYSIKTQAEDIKKADNKLKNILREIEKQAREKQIEFSVREK
jgi:translation initiation factor 2 subunit 1